MTKKELISLRKPKTVKSKYVVQKKSYSVRMLQLQIKVINDLVRSYKDICFDKHNHNIIYSSNFFETQELTNPNLKFNINSMLSISYKFKNNFIYYNKIAREGGIYGINIIDRMHAYHGKQRFCNYEKYLTKLMPETKKFVTKKIEEHLIDYLMELKEDDRLNVIAKSSYFSENMKKYMALL